MSVTVDGVVDYMGTVDASKWAVVDGDETTYPEIANALAAETALQRRATRRVYDVEAQNVLDEALKRRVVHNLAMRAIPLATMPGNVEVGTAPVRPPAHDPEVRRMERPYRRVQVG